MRYAITSPYFEAKTISKTIFADILPLLGLHCIYCTCVLLIITENLIITEIQVRSHNGISDYERIEKLSTSAPVCFKFAVAVLWRKPFPCRCT